MARHLESERNRLRNTLTDILNWVEENVQPANSLMGVRPKAVAAVQAPPAPAPLPQADDGQPTLNLQSTSGQGFSGGTGSV